MSAVEFVPTWQLCRCVHSRCSLCGRIVENEEVWRFWAKPDHYVSTVCRACAETAQEGEGHAGPVGI
jgi:hypothetical protein